MSDNNINVTAPIHAATKKGKLGAAKEIFLEGDTQTVEKEIQDINSRHNDLSSKHESLSSTVSEHTKQIESNQSQITANKSAQDEKNTSLDANMAKLNTRDDQITELVKGVTATGGASVATAVSYDNTSSNLDAATVQGALDELVNKKVSKEDIAQELGDSKEKVISQSALPFRYIQNEEFIFAKVDAEDKLLFGILWDGTPKFGKTSEVEDELQEQITILAERVAAIIGDDDTTSVIDTLNELKDFFANIENTQSLTDILANLDNVAKNLDKTTIKDEEGNVQDTPFRVIESPEFFKVITDSEDRFLCGIQQDGSIEWSKGIPAPIRAKLQEIVSQIQLQITNLQETKVDKEEGKSLIENEVKECFRIIENEEFIMAVVDSENRVLFGIYRESGKPYFPLNEMYHVEQNEEFFAVWLDADDKVVLGIRRDGQIFGEIHAVNALKQVISQLQSDIASLQEKVGTIDSIKELLDIFSLQENPEYMAVEKDADDKVLSATYNDGSHYSHNLKSETIDAKVDKEEGKSLIDEDVADAHGTLEDPEGRTEITTDSEDNILGYRDSEGTRHEHKLAVSHISLSQEAANEVNNTFKSAGIKMENPSDFSKDSYVELPIPRVAAQVKIYASKLPTTKQDDIEAEIEYNDKDGNYFRKPAILNSQGSSSMGYIDKKTGERGNIAIDINDDSKIKFGDFPSQDSFHLKKYYIDVFRGQCIVAYWLMEQVYQTRPIGKRYPYEMNSKEHNPYSGEGKTNNDFYTGAKCHPDGFPVVVTWVNTQTKEEKKIGIYAWNLKKSKEVYFANKKNPKNIILDGVIGNDTLFGGKVDWNQFEIRNPKSLIDINGAKYDGDNPKELSDTDANSKKVKDYIIRLSGVKAALEESNTKETFEKYFIVDAFIDYYIISQVIYHVDGFLKNWIWCTWNGIQWAPTLYDTDSIWGMFWNGIFIIKDSDVKGLLGTNAVLGLETLYAEEIKARYKELRDKNVFSVENITNLLKKWLDKIGYENMYNEIELYPDTPSYRSSNLNEGWEFVWYSSKENNYDAEKTYNAGETCIYIGCVFRATKMLTNVPPLSSSYANAPHGYGCYNSIKRVSVWLTNRLAFLDTTYSYTNV